VALGTCFFFVSFIHVFCSNSIIETGERRLSSGYKIISYKIDIVNSMKFTSNSMKFYTVLSEKFN
jgi:hypothetical protein